jgi:hypothetical protein
MTRRTVRFFVTLTLGLLVASLAVAAPPSAHIPRIGLLSVLSPAIGEAKAESFRQGLRELGYLEGRDTLLETAVYHPATFAGLPGQLGVYPPMPPALTRHDLEHMLAQGLSPREMSKRTSILRAHLTSTPFSHTPPLHSLSPAQQGPHHRSSPHVYAAVHSILPPQHVESRVGTPPHADYGGILRRLTRNDTPRSGGGQGADTAG